MMYNRTFNDKWGLEMVLPVKIKGRYSFNSSNVLLFGTEFNSLDYSIDIVDYAGGGTNSMINHMRRAEINGSVEFMHQFSKWFWWSIKGGYVHHLNSEFINPDVANDVNFVAPENGPFIKVGLFVSPPRKKRR